MHLKGFCVSWFLVGCYLSKNALSQEVCTSNVKKYCESQKAKTTTACLTVVCKNAVQVYNSNDDAAFKNSVLDAHNKYRKAKVAGHYGADMLKMSWDEELAQTALKWAQYLCDQNDSLGPGHDDCRATPSYSRVGQNLAWGSGSKWSGSIDGDILAVAPWNAENKTNEARQEENMYPFRFIAGIGHYTQVMWSRSYKLGCAYVTSKTTRDVPQGWIACNYAIQGNLVGENVVKKGNLGSDCPAGSKQGDDKLCQVTDENTIRTTLKIKSP